MVDKLLKNPTLWGGVNKQDDHMRHPNQVADAVNILFDIRYGASKRPPSYMLTAISMSEGDYKLHVIKQDTETQYIVVFGEGALRVFDTDGVQQTVNISSAADAYLFTGANSNTKLKMVSIAGKTIIVRTDVETAMKRSDDYQLAKTFTDYKHLLSNQLTTDDYARAIDDDSIKPAGYWKYIHSGSTFEEHKTGSLAAGWDQVSEWERPERNPGGVTIGVRTFAVVETGVSWDTTAKTITKAGAFAGYTFTAGDVLHVTDGTNVHASHEIFPIVSKDSDDQLTVTDPSPASHGFNRTDWEIDGIGRTFEAVWDLDTTGDSPDFTHLIKRVQEYIHDAGGYGDDTLINYTEDDLVTFVAPTAGEEGGLLGFFPIDRDGHIDWSRSVSAAGSPFDNAQIDSVGSRTAGTGTPSSLLFPKEDRWEQVPAPNQANAAFDETTMPVEMIHNTDPVSFDVDVIDWTPRFSGSDANNPAPTPFKEGKTISAIMFHRTRLCIGIDTHMVFSEVDKPYNFFWVNALEYVDTDPIDHPLSSNEINIIEDMIPFTLGAVIFTKAGQQFELSAPDVFKLETVKTDVSTKIQSQANTPVAAGNYIYFAGTTTLGTSKIYEYYYQEALLATEAVDITTHVFSLLPADIYSIGVVENTNTIYVAPASGTDFFVYQYFWLGDRKEQSAWSTWTIDSDEIGETIVVEDTIAIDDNIYMLTATSGFSGTDNYHLMKVASAAQDPDAGMPFVVHLDRIQLLTGVYDGVSDRTYFVQSPYDSACTHVVLGAGAGASAGKSLPIVAKVSGTSTMWVDGDYSGIESYVGREYSCSLTLNRFYDRDDKGAVDLATNVSIATLQVKFLNTGSFITTRSVTNSNDATRTVEASEFTIQSGAAVLDLQGDTSETTYTIQSSDHKPMTITAVEANVQLTRSVI